MGGLVWFGIWSEPVRRDGKRNAAVLRREGRIPEVPGDPLPDFETGLLKRNVDPEPVIFRVDRVRLRHQAALFPGIDAAFVEDVADGV